MAKMMKMKMMMTNVYQKQVKTVTKEQASFVNQLNLIGLNGACPDSEKAPLYTVTNNIYQANYILSNQLATMNIAGALATCQSAQASANNLVNLITYMPYPGNTTYPNGQPISGCQGSGLSNAITIAKTMAFHYSVLVGNLQQANSMSSGGASKIARFGNYAPSDIKTVKLMLDAAKFKEGEVLVDLGCGDGRILVEAVKRGAKKVIGVDSDRKRIRTSEKKITKHEAAEKSELQHCDIMEMKGLEKADVVTMYLWTAGMEEIKPMLLQKLKKGTRIVSHQFKFKSWKPVSTHDIPGKKQKVYVYVV